MQDRHWIFVQKLADDLKCDIIVPIYSLVPLSTSTTCIQTCIELLAHLERDDVRYRGKQVVLMGDSAGGWIALRLLLALMERHAGKSTFRDREDHLTIEDLKIEKEDIDYKAILDSISDVVMISPVVDTSVDRPEDLEVAERVRHVRSFERSLAHTPAGPLAIQNPHRHMQPSMELRPHSRLPHLRLQRPRFAHRSTHRLRRLRSPVFR
jgi:hypothetical protein